MFKDINKNKNQDVDILLIGRIATNIADSLFYITILWYFKTTFHSPVALSLIFIADSTIDMCAFLFGPLIDRVYIKKLLKSVTIGQTCLSLVVTLLFYFEDCNQIVLVLLLLTYVSSTIGSFLGGIIVQRVSASFAISLHGIAEVITAVFYLLIFNKKS